VHDPSLRDEHGGAGVLQLCLLVAEHAPEVREKKTCFFAIPVHTFAKQSIVVPRQARDKQTHKARLRERSLYMWVYRRCRR
jgi:hypothetical protein